MLVLEQYTPSVRIENIQDEMNCKTILLSTYGINPTKLNIARGLFELHNHLIVLSSFVISDRQLYNYYSSSILHVENFSELDIRLEALKEEYLLVDKLTFDDRNNRISMRFNLLKNTTIYNAVIAIFRKNTIDTILNDLSC